jgi:xylulokinase
MDSSTSEQCREIARAAGGEEEVARITGSRAIERFTGPQIRRFSQRDPGRYQATKRIHLVSSFLTALLCDADAPIDRGDGAGMNLLDLATGDWSETMLEATAPKLRVKLPPVVASDTVVGTVSSRLPFAHGTPVVAGSGDNPCSLVGMGAIHAGTAVISLGTSDTYFAAADAPVIDPAGFGHTFGNPAGGFMGLIAVENGSLARDEVRRRCGLDWDGFARAILEETRPGNDGALMLPYFVPEITPRIPEPRGPVLYGEEEFTSWQRPAAAARAVVEGQALSLREHTAWLGARPAEVLVTGGASRNEGILRVLADVFGARLRRLEQSNAAALGAALRAAHAAGGHDWDELFAAFAAPDPAQDVTPDPAAAAVYDEMAPVFAARVRERYPLG